LHLLRDQVPLSTSGKSANVAHTNQAFRLACSYRLLPNVFFDSHKTSGLTTTSDDTPVKKSPGNYFDISKLDQDMI
jgi:hypothetical protein